MFLQKWEQHCEMATPVEYLIDNPHEEVAVPGTSQQNNISVSGAVFSIEDGKTISNHLSMISTEECVFERTRDLSSLKNCQRSLELDSECNNPDFSAANSDTNLNADASPVKKNRRKKKIKDSTHLASGRSLVENDPFNTLEDSSGAIETLNEVFNSWSLHSISSDAIRIHEKKRSAKENKNEVQGSEIINSTGVSEVTQTCQKIVPGVSCGIEYASSPRNSQSSDSNNTVVSGYPKSTEKKKKIRKKFQQKNDESLQTGPPKNVGFTETRQEKSVRSSMTDEHYPSSSVKATEKSKSFNINRKKKLSHDGEKCNDDVSLDLAKNMDQLYVLLNSTSVLSESGHTDTSIGTPGSSTTANENRLKLDNVEENDFKHNRRVSIELQKLDKIAKKIIKKQDITSEGQKKKKKKEKLKGKNVVNDSSSNSNVLEKSVTSSVPKQKTSREKDEKKKSKKFEEYWTLDAVKEGLQNGTVIEGAIRINPKRYTEAYVSSPNGSQDILIEGMTDRNRALEGDLVALLLKDPSEWKLNSSRTRQESYNNRSFANTLETYEEEELLEDSSILENDFSKKSQVTGKVVAILSNQHSRKCVGYLKLMKKPNDKNALFSPRDVRIPRMQIPHDKCPPDFWLDPESKKNVLYLARMTKWTTGTFALGEIVEEIGQTANVDAETEAILLDNDLDVTPYPAAFSEEFQSFSSSVIEEQLKIREDLRKECIFTIDPQTAKDLDDAVSCKELSNGNFEIGVHISDVTFFLKEGSPLDEEVSKRATSTYLVENVYHMLPVELCLLCSLLPGQDKLAYSVVWEMTRDAEVVSQRIGRSVINSCVKFAYEHAQTMIENPGKEWDQNDFPKIGNGFSLSDISKVVNNLQMIAKQLRRKRFDDGALRIDQTKVFLHLDSTGMPVSVHEYINQESNRLIEEFMLLANMTVAKFIYEKFPNVAFLRCHQEPHRWPLEQLQEAMASRGIHLNITSAGDLQASLSRHAGTDYLSQTRLMVLNALCAKTMTRAKYFCTGGCPEEEFWHYALSVPYYTHFTSPIRRYADVMVHRLLNAGLHYSPEPSWSEEYVCGIASVCNKKKYSAKLAGEQSVKLYLSVYVRQHQPVLEDAVVVDVKDHSFDVIVCKYGLTMRVYTSKLDVDVECNAGKKVSSMRIIWRCSAEYPESTVQIVEVFTIVKVKIFCCEDSLKLEAVLHRPVKPDSLAVLSGDTQ